MPKKPTFILRQRDGETRETPYTPIVYTRGHEAWRLALHRVNGPGSEWTVSDPVSGKRVCRVTATYKGVPVASGSLTQRQAQQCALVDLDALVDRVGLERFSAVLSAAQTPETANHD